MKEEEYRDMVSALFKNPKEILESLDGQKTEALHGAIGISGEAGELLDAIKKYAVYNKAIDLNNLIEELGDLEFYMEALRQTFGISRKETLTANMKKLLTGEKARYKTGKYTDEQAQNRRDKQEVLGG